MTKMFADGLRRAYRNCLKRLNYTERQEIYQGDRECHKKNKKKF